MCTFVDIDVTSWLGLNYSMKWHHRSFVMRMPQVVKWRLEVLLSVSDIQHQSHWVAHQVLVWEAESESIENLLRDRALVGLPTLCTSWHTPYPHDRLSLEDKYTEVNVVGWLSDEVSVCCRQTVPAVAEAGTNVCQPSHLGHILEKNQHGGNLDLGLPNNLLYSK